MTLFRQSGSRVTGLMRIGCGPTYVLSHFLECSFLIVWYSYMMYALILNAPFSQSPHTNNGSLGGSPNVGRNFYFYL